MLGCIPEWQEGSGAFGARVLSFVRFAPNDGFGPGTASPSGRVLRAPPSGVIKYHCAGEVRRPNGRQF